MTKFKILAIATTFLALTSCSKEYNSDLQKQIDETRAKSDQIRANSIQAEEAKVKEAKAKIEQPSKQEIPIPISDTSDKGTYFLISKEKTDKGFIIIYKRVGVAQTTFSKYEIQCKSKKMRVLGEGVDSADNVHDYAEKGEWFTPVAEASTGDAFNFVCDNNNS